MAPFNLIDLAIKEIKIPKAHLVPMKKKSYSTRFLLAHGLDFFLLTWVSAIVLTIFKHSSLVFMDTKILQTVWFHTNFTSYTFFSLSALSFTYFLLANYLNQGQTLGMKIMKCRIDLKDHHLSSSARWAFFSLSVVMTFGLSFSFAFKKMSHHSPVGASDQKWLEMMEQKEEIAPSLHSLLEKEETSEEFSAAA